jgi:hypothetical protein
MGAGPDFSSQSLKEQFQEARISKDFFTMQIAYKNHAIVHAACLDEQNTVPAAIMPHSGSWIKATVNFLSMDQQEALTRSKPDCDLLLLKDPLSLSPHSTSVRMLLHSNVWGALSDDCVNPLARIGGQATTLEKISPSQALKRVTEWLGKGYPIKNQMTDEERLIRNALTQAWHGRPLRDFPLGPEATSIKLASVREVAENLNLPISPVSSIKEPNLPISPV